MNHWSHFLSGHVSIGNRDRFKHRSFFDKINFFLTTDIYQIANSKSCCSLELYAPELGPWEKPLLSRLFTINKVIDIPTHT